MPTVSGNRTYRELQEQRQFKWWYDAIIDWRMTNPGKTNAECAAALGKNPNYISLVVNSDMFKAHEADRRRQFNSQLNDAISNKLAQSTVRALDIVLETLEKKRDSIPFAATTDFLQKSLASLGYGAKQSGSVVNVNVGGPQLVAAPVTAAELALAREDLRRAEEQRRALTIEGQSERVLELEHAPMSSRGS